MISPEYCHVPPVQRSPSFSMSSSWLPGLLLSLIDMYNAPSLLWPMADAMLEGDDLKGRSVHELAADSWKLITYHRVC